MKGVRFFADRNWAVEGANGLAILTGHVIRARDARGRMKSGWEGFRATREGAGDGPYHADRVSADYVGKHCTAISEARARKLFPKLVRMVEGSKNIWDSSVRAAGGGAGSTELPSRLSLLPSTPGMPGETGKLPGYAGAWGLHPPREMPARISR